MTEGKRLRQVKSFVKREGRLTPGQQKALDVLWPKFGIEADNQPIDMQTLFGRDAPVVFEIGFGNGASLIEMAIHQPDNDFIGVEVHRPGVGQLLKAIEENNLSSQPLLTSWHKKYSRAVFCIWQQTGRIMQNKCCRICRQVMILSIPAHQMILFHGRTTVP